MLNNSKKMARSPDRNTFQRDSYMKRKAEEGKTPENDKEVATMADFYNKVLEDCENKEADEEWKKYNLEYDLRSAEWVSEKVKKYPYYAQNLYAAMCNNEFQKLEIVPILTEKRWSCSWRHAGGIIADLRESGDYIDWYCSGVRDDYEELGDGRKYVSESVVSEEVRRDLLTLGWKILEYNNDK